MPMKRQLLRCFPVQIVLVFAALSVLPGPAVAEAPPFQVKVELDVPVRMRDGVRLAADIYIPLKDGRPLESKLPAVLQRTPYNKAGLAGMATFFAAHGYLSVIQDSRGRFASEGDFFPFVDEPK